MQEDIIIVDNSERFNEFKTIKKFIKAVNDVMKKADNSKSYYVYNGIAFSSTVAQIPKEVKYEINAEKFFTKKQFEIYKELLEKGFFSYIVNDWNLIFDFYKNFDKIFNKIILSPSNNTITLYASEKNLVLPLCNKMENTDDNFNICYSNFSCTDKEVIDTIIGHKSFYKLYIDLENEKLLINTVPDSESYTVLIVGKKYLCGINKSEEIFVEIFGNDNDERLSCLLKIVLTFSNSKQKTSNTFIVVDI